MSQCRGIFTILPVAKYQKLKGDPLEALKNFRKKTRNENFEKCHSAEKCKRETFGIFNIHSIAKYQKNSGTLWCKQKVSL